MHWFWRAAIAMVASLAYLAALTVSHDVSRTSINGGLLYELHELLHQTILAGFDSLGISRPWFVRLYRALALVVAFGMAPVIIATASCDLLTRCFGIKLLGRAMIRNAVITVSSLLAAATLVRVILGFVAPIRFADVMALHTTHPRHTTTYHSYPFSFWLPIAVAFSIYPAIAFIRGPYRRYRRRKKGLCLKCGYDLQGNVSGICPECGTKI